MLYARRISQDVKQDCRRAPLFRFLCISRHRSMELRLRAAFCPHLPGMGGRCSLSRLVAESPHTQDSRFGPVSPITGRPVALCSSEVRQRQPCFGPAGDRWAIRFILGFRTACYYSRAEYGTTSSLPPTHTTRRTAFRRPNRLGICASFSAITCKAF